MTKLNTTMPLARYDVASGATIQPGNLVALDSTGKAVPASDTAGLTVIGFAGRSDAEGIEVFDGVIGMSNASGNAALTRADRGAAAYVAGAAQVGKTSANSIPAGVVVDVFDGEVFIDCTPAALAACK